MLDNFDQRKETSEYRHERNDRDDGDLLSLDREELSLFCSSVYQNIEIETLTLPLESERRNHDHNTGFGNER